LHNFSNSMETRNMFVNFPYIDSFKIQALECIFRFAVFIEKETIFSYPLKATRLQRTTIKNIVWNLETIEASFSNKFIMQISPIFLYDSNFQSFQPWRYTVFLHSENLNYSHICGLSLCCCQFNCNLHFAVCVHLWLMVTLLHLITNAPYIYQPVWPCSSVQFVLISHLLCRLCGIIVSPSFMLVTFCSYVYFCLTLNK
jgi:hypothetical protein